MNYGPQKLARIWSILLEEKLSFYFRLPFLGISVFFNEKLKLRFDIDLSEVNQRRNFIQNKINTRRVTRGQNFKGNELIYKIW